MCPPSKEARSPCERVLNSIGLRRRGEEDRECQEAYGILRSAYWDTQQEVSHSSKAASRALPSVGTWFHKEVGQRGGWMHDLTAKIGVGKAYTPYPEDDPFYEISAQVTAFDNLAAGVIVHSRPIKLQSFPGLNAAKMKAWQLAHTYKDLDGHMRITVAVVIRPPTSQGDKIICHGSKTDASIPKCRTSYSLRKGSPDRWGSLSESLFLGAWLDQGWIVVVSDYNGVRDAFGDGPTNGRCFLDSARAAASFDALQLKQDYRMTFYGYSSGAMAAAWAAQLQKTYAPELGERLLGYAIGGLPVDIEGVAYHVNKSIAAGLLAGVMGGLANVNPDLGLWLKDVLTDKGLELLNKVYTECFKGFMLASFEVDILGPEYFKIADPLKHAEVQKILQRLRLGGASADCPSAPMFLSESLHDEVVPIAQTDKLVDDWAKRGATIEYVRDELSAHVILCFTSFPHALRWLKDRFEGKENAAKPGQPIRKTVSTSLLYSEEAGLLGSEEPILSQARLAQFQAAEKLHRGKCWWY